MANLETLTVKLGADDSELDSGLSGAESKVSKFAKGIKTAVVAGGTAAGAALGVALAKSMEFEAANDKMAASLDLTAAESERVGKLAGDLYSNAYGGSLEEVNTALAGVQTNIGDLGSFSDAELTDMGAKALSLATILGEDVSRVTRGVGQLMRNDLAPNAETAFDIIAAAQSKVSADMKGELIDTVEEYSADFASLGLTGEQSMAMIVGSLQAGARNTDLAADAIREFSIRAVDGSKSTTEAFEDLGLNAEDMASKIAAGGPVAAAAMSEVIGALGGVGDKVAQEEIGVALFGTRFEEMGMKAISAMDPATASLENMAGAMDRQDEALNSNAQTMATTWTRSIETWLASLFSAESALGKVGGAAASFGGGAIDMAGNVGMAVLAMRGLGFTALFSGAKVAAGGVMAAASSAASMAVVAASWTRTAVVATLSAARMALAWAIGVGLGAAAAVVGMIAASVVIVARWVWMGVQAMASAVRMAAAWIVAMGPIGWVIAAVVGLVLLIIANWDKVKAVSISVWNAVWGFVKTAWGWIEGKVAEGVAWILAKIDYLQRIPGRVADYFGRMKTAAIVKLMELVNWVHGLRSKILTGLGNLGSLLYNAGKNVIQGLINGIKAMIGAVGRAIGSVASKIRNALPFSPAKEGPLSGRGSPDIAGRKVADMLAAGLLARQSVVRSAMDRIAGSMSVGGLSDAGEAAQQILAQLNRGGQVFEDFSFRGSSALVGKHNDAIAEAYRAAGGGDPRRFLQDYVAAQRIPASGGGQVPQVHVTGDDALINALLERLRKVLRERGLGGVLG